MRRAGLVWVVLFSLLLCSLSGCTLFKPTQNVNVLRVMTFNIRHGEGLDGEVDIRRIAKTILDAEPDVVALQEVDRHVERSKKIDIIVMLSELTGMTYAFGKTIDYEGGDYGNAFLTKYPILEERNLLYRMGDAGEQRGLMQLVLEVDGREVVLMNTHLDHRADDAERMSSVGQLLRAVKRYEARPVIVCGDFNDDPGSRVIGSMKDEFVDVWGEVGSGDGLTYPAQNPARRVDYIFLSKQQGVESLRPRSARVVATNASDHLPLVVEFEISN